MYKGFKVKLYPNKEQQKLIFQFIGSARYAYNWVIAIEQENYENGGKFLGKAQLNKLWKEHKSKEENSWIKKMSGRSIRGGIYNAVESYERFFNGLSEYPKFKSKKSSKKSFRTHECNTLIEPNRIKFEKLGWVKCKNNIPCTWSKKASSISDKTLCNPTISYDGVDFWFSVSIEVDDCTINKSTEQTEAIGIDLGIKKLATDSSHIDCTKPDIKKHKKKLKRLQKRASRYYLRRQELSIRTRTKLKDIPKSKNLIKLEREINKVYKKISNKLNTNIHEYTAHLIKLNPKAIVIEDLDVTGMLKNRHLSEKVKEAKFYEFRRQLEYKCEWNDVKLIIADRWFPSSKLCNCCGNKKIILNLNERTYKCEKCGYIEDRDYNASLNLKDLAYN